MRNNQFKIGVIILTNKFGKYWYNIKKYWLTILGDIKIYKWPFFLIYHPTTFRIKGVDTIEALHFLQKGDIIQRKYDDYLDGKLIPGKYSHSAIYMGGGNILHAIAEGVSIINFIDFFRCDGFRIIRPVNLNQNQINEAIDNISNLIGKPYDFDFTGKNDKYYCHELVAQCYNDYIPIPKLIPKIWIFKGTPCYLAESFESAKNLKIIMEK